MELTKQQRLVLYNQYEILKKLKQDDEREVKDCEYYQKIILEGFEAQYDELIAGFSEDVNKNVSDFVFDVLQLHRVLLNSYIELSKAEKSEINIQDIKYDGFDGNEETDYYRYANFVLEDMERFPEILEDKDVELNSHANRVPMYEKMIDAWKTVRNNKYEPLELEKMKQVINSKWNY